MIVLLTLYTKTKHYWIYIIKENNYVFTHKGFPDVALPIKDYTIKDFTNYLDQNYPELLI
jgi:hypothetical protein